MFTLAFISQQGITEATDLAEEPTLAIGSGPTAKLENDRAVEVLPRVRIRMGRSVVVGSLQITLMEVVGATARLQLEPRGEVEVLGSRRFSYSAGVDSADDLVTRPATEVLLGGHLDFGFRGRLYQLGLLEVELPLWGFAPTGTQKVLPSHAAVRLLDLGVSYANSGNTNAPISGSGNVPAAGR